MEQSKIFPQNIINTREECLRHADDLLRAAKRVFSEEELPHIAYHLATLALEEIGRQLS